MEIMTNRASTHNNLAYMSNKIAKLIYQSKHRGCKENDILLDRFVDKIAELSLPDLDLYEQFLNEDDVDIYNWLCNINFLPEKYNNLIKLFDQTQT